MLAWGGCRRSGDVRDASADVASETSASDVVADGDMSLDPEDSVDTPVSAEVDAIEADTSEPNARDDGDTVDALTETADALAEGEDVALADADRMTCRVLKSDLMPLPEASGAALMDTQATRILVVADSGNAGRALIMDLIRGESKGIVLPLGEGAGDDVEGLERAPDGRIFGLTSSGFMRAWAPVAGSDELALVLGPVAISADPEWVCDPFGVNCAANFEGLCLHPAPAMLEAGVCVGWAAAKARGELVCLRQEGEGYRLDPTTRVTITAAEQLSGCAYEPVVPYRLVAGGNLYSFSALWEVAFDASGLARVLTLGETGAANQEAVLLLPDGRLESFGDAQDLLGDESPHISLECH